MAGAAELTMIAPHFLSPPGSSQRVGEKARQETKKKKPALSRIHGGVRYTMLGGGGGDTMSNPRHRGPHLVGLEGFGARVECPTTVGLNDAEHDMQSR